MIPRITAVLGLCAVCLIASVFMMPQTVTGEVLVAIATIDGTHQSIAQTTGNEQEAAIYACEISGVNLTSSLSPGALTTYVATNSENGYRQVEVAETKFPNLAIDVTSLTYTDDIAGVMTEGIRHPGETKEVSALTRRGLVGNNAGTTVKYDTDATTAKTGLLLRA